MLDLSDYLPLKQAAFEMGIAYSTAHVYAYLDLLPGAIKVRGTRWYIHRATIERFKNGSINVKGAFSRKRSGEQNN